MKPRMVLYGLCAAVVSAACAPADCTAVNRAHAAVRPGMSLGAALLETEKHQVPDIDWFVRAGDASVPTVQISKQPFRIRVYDRPTRVGDLSDSIPYIETGYGSRQEFEAAVAEAVTKLSAYREFHVSMGCLRGGLDRKEFTITATQGTVRAVSPIEHVSF